MSDSQYPLFEAGQTLTAADLNLLRSFLHERDRLVGRMIGFGVNCGLGGTVTDSTLTIQPGLAVDQDGEPLLLATGRELALPPTPATPSYDFVTAGPGGFSVVLEMSDTVEPVPDCGEADCAGHAELHTRGVDVRVVTGRVTGTRMDFSGESLLAVEPIRLSLDSQPINDYGKLRDAIATRLTNGTSPLVDPRLITQLQATSVLASESKGSKGYKCGWLNMVLFAALDLLRCEALVKLGCDRTTARAGVVLGWVHQVGTSWVFDCSYRHAWEPPRGFSQAFLGGTCADPCGRFRDALEALIAGYAPPDPVPSGPVKPPEKCPVGSILVKGRCVNIYYPPVEIPPDWNHYWEVEPIDPLGPVWYPPFEEPGWVNPWEVYGTDPWNYFDDGVIGMSQYVGQPGDEVRGALETAVLEGGGIADVKVLNEADAVALDGYLPAGGFSPSDTAVLTVNRNGKLVATGRVAAVRNTRKVGAALPAAQTAVAEAQAVATELKDVSESLETSFQTLSTTVAGVAGKVDLLKVDFESYKGSEFERGGIGVRLENLETALDEFKAYGTRISSLEGSLDVITKRPGAAAPPVKGLEIGSGQGLTEFAETTLAALEALGEQPSPNFQRHKADVARAVARFEVDVASDDPVIANASTLEVLKTMRTMVKGVVGRAGDPGRLGPQLDAQIRALERRNG